METAAAIIANVLKDPDNAKFRRVGGSRLRALLATTGGREALTRFGFTPAADESGDYVLPSAPLAEAAAFGSSVIEADAQNRAAGRLSLDMLQSTIAGTLRAFSFKWAARSPLLRIGVREAEQLRVASASSGVCKFCLLRGPDMSMPCATCSLSACSNCDWRSHLVGCARCLKVVCATCLNADAAFVACKKCKLLVCSPLCTGCGGPAPCDCTT